MNDYQKENTNPFTRIDSPVMWSKSRCRKEKTLEKSLYNINGEVTAEQYDQVCHDMAKQQLMKTKYKLPTFDCPCCGAKKILFAGDTVSKNETVVEMFRENGIADYVIVCPKCRQYIAVRRHAGKEHSGAYFRTIGGKSISYTTVYNNRVRGIYHNCPEHELIFEGEIVSDGSVREKVAPIYNTVTYYYPGSNRYRLYYRKQREKYYEELNHNKA